MEIMKLILVFFVIVVMLWMKRPLYQAILAAIATTAVFYRIMPGQCLVLFFQVLTDWNSMSVIVILYLITFLQRMLEQRKQIQLARQDLNGLFNNRRVNATLAPIFIGLLPSAAAMILCGDIVKSSTDGYLDRKEQAFVTSWFRHIPESTLPTYSGVLLMANLTGVPISTYMLGMIVPVICLILVAYIPYIRRLPRDTGAAPSKNRKADALHLLQHLWTLLVILLLILMFRISVINSIGIVILLAVVVYRFRWSELRPMFASAFETRMLVNSFLVLVLKAFVSHTGIIGILPGVLAGLPIPTYLIFALLFFFGCIITGSNGIIALGAAMAFAAIPDAGMPLMVLLMCMTHTAMQISPTHICLVVASEYYDVTMGDMVRKTVPVIAVFCLLMLGYYHILCLF